MIVAESRAELREALGAGSEQLTLVPTMGALHEGHAALLDVARNRAGRVVTSIFVNPLQFAPGEDLARYPRTFDADLALCRDHGVDVVFAPAVEAVYPGGDPLVTIEPGPQARDLEGAARPGHFRGVLTVVAKLFGLVQPDAAVFGQKDYQQLVLIRQLAKDLCLPIDIIGAETVRDGDGLALSSRNRYLTGAERAVALTLSRALLSGRAAAADGPEAVLAQAQDVLASEPDVRLDYLELRGTDLSEHPDAGPARLLIAAKVGSTRLIDNVAVELRRSLSPALTSSRSS